MPRVTAIETAGLVLALLGVILAILTTPSSHAIGWLLVTLSGMILIWWVYFIISSGT